MHTDTDPTPAHGITRPDLMLSEISERQAIRIKIDSPSDETGALWVAIKDTIERFNNVTTHPQTTIEMHHTFTQTETIDNNPF